MPMYYQRLSDDEIIEGFREGDSDIIREYFYGYCEVGYRLFDQRYQLSGKQHRGAGTEHKAGGPQDAIHPSQLGAASLAGPPLFFFLIN